MFYLEKENPLRIALSGFSVEMQELYPADSPRRLSLSKPLSEYS
jgi:hypothetical protein